MQFAVGAVLAIVLLMVAWLRITDRAATEELSLPELVVYRSLPPSGKQYVVVFIGDSECGACRDAELPGTVRTIVNQLRRQAVARNAALSSMAVALDRNFGAGIQWLEPFGAFDEISVGGGWLGSNAVRYVWRDYPGRPATPQIVVLERDLDVSPERIRVGDEEVILRRTGLDQITAWAADGAALPESQ